MPNVRLHMLLQYTASSISIYTYVLNNDLERMSDKRDQGAIALQANVFLQIRASNLASGAAHPVNTYTSRQNLKEK